MSDITKQSLTELVESIKNKKLSSSEVTKAFIERSEKSKVLNAFINYLVFQLPLKIYFAQRMSKQLLVAKF